MKILTSDLDGTLIQNKTIKESVIKKLDEFLSEETNHFIIATGRSYNKIKHLQRLILSSYIIACNGGAIYDSTGKEIYKALIPQSAVKSILDLAEKEAVIFISNGKDVFNRENCGDILDDVVFLSVNPITKDEAKINHLMQRIEAISDQISVVRNGKTIDVAARGCSKGNALKKLAAQNNWDESEICVVGDNYNDISMFEAFSNSYAITDGVRAAVEKAQHLVDNVGDIIRPDYEDERYKE